CRHLVVPEKHGWSGAKRTNGLKESGDQQLHWSALAKASDVIPGFALPGTRYVVAAAARSPGMGAPGEPRGFRFWNSTGSAGFIDQVGRNSGRTPLAALSPKASEDRAEAFAFASSVRTKSWRLFAMDV